MINWQTLANHFQYQVLTPGLLRPILKNQVTRAGLALAGFVIHKQIKAVVLWGKEEYMYLLKHPYQKIASILNEFMALQPPLVVLSRSFQVNPLLIQIAANHQVTIVKTNLASAQLTYAINHYLAESLATEKLIHGNLMECYGLGVLIQGSSGIGKSEICLELIKKHHLFVADDAILCSNVYNKVLGQAPAHLQGFMEVRGLGIINVTRYFGIERFKKSTQINCIVNLHDYQDSPVEYDRLGKDLQYQELVGVLLPQFTLPVTKGRKMSDLIEVTVAKLKLIETGYSSYEALTQQLEAQHKNDD